jgi:hypothetical protein
MIINKTEVVEFLSLRNLRNKIVIRKIGRTESHQRSIRWLGIEKYLVLLDQVNIPGDVIDVFILTKKGTSLCEKLRVGYNNTERDGENGQTDRPSP